MNFEELNVAVARPGHLRAVELRVKGLRESATLDMGSSTRFSSLLTEQEGNELYDRALVKRREANRLSIQARAIRKVAKSTALYVIDWRQLFGREWVSRDKLRKICCAKDHRVAADRAFERMKVRLREAGFAIDVRQDSCAKGFQRFLYQLRWGRRDREQLDRLVALAGDIEKPEAPEIPSGWELEGVHQEAPLAKGEEVSALVVLRNPDGQLRTGWTIGQDSGVDPVVLAVCDSVRGGWRPSQGGGE